MLKRVLFHQTRQNGYQTVSFDVLIHNLMFVLLLDKFSILFQESENNADLSHMHNGHLELNNFYSGLKQVILGQTRQNGYQINSSIWCVHS